LIVGEAGTSVLWDGGGTTVRFDDCVAMLKFDWGRRLMARAGYLLDVEAAHWQQGEDAIRRLHAAVPAKLVINMG
jgi:hypothetical protein